ncbi:hypothetical protein K503DRAFT_811559 [Rhizopogon vinicolor AM-OR11-026]|uniref:Uncharacterized protein n=1 Tax=Rhizopogon vinicolor AM-OR11-026 TaxID=1314800 RepID=A0A1B7MG93_9AGAM|nr:hypothetical protein K503DRAFT_811559 [Rhizopogon vinicolor AM-OR11-026]
MSATRTRKSTIMETDPLNSRDLSPTIGPNTRKTTRTPLTQTEIEAIPNPVTDHISAEKYLSKTLISQIDEPYTLTHLTSILLHITQISGNTPLPVITAIRVVAFIMKKHTACEIATAAAKQLMDTLSSHIVNNVIGAIAPHVANVLSTSESMTSTLEQDNRLYQSIKAEHDEKEGNTSIAVDCIEEAANNLFESIGNCQKALKTLSLSLDATQDRVNQLSTQLPTAPPQTQLPVNTKPSYSAVAAALLPPTVDQAVGRAAIRARQVLLDPKPGDNLFPPNTSNADIVKKLKEALSNARDESTPHGDIKAISTLKNGGIIVEMENENLATWLRHQENQRNS